jgi:hypothetical protein
VFDAGKCRLFTSHRLERDCERQRDTGESRMHTGLQHEHPRHDADEHVPDDPLDPGEVQDCQNGQRRQCDIQGQPGEFVRVEDGDDDDRTQIVDDCERGQKELEGGGDPAAEQRHHPEPEGDIGGRGGRPTGKCARRTPGEPEIDQRRHDHAADRSGRQDGPPPVGELSLKQLAFDPQSDEQKENRHQPVIDPQQHRLLDAKIADAHRAAHAQQQIVDACEGRVGEHKREG